MKDREGVSHSTKSAGIRDKGVLAFASYRVLDVVVRRRAGGPVDTG